jgi:dTDP-4-dehydrorhamnose 3,5-epimerase
MYIPPGFAHGFLTLSEHADIIYKCTDYYVPQDERAIIWSDPRLNIQWPLAEGNTPLLSVKDAKAEAFIRG